MRQVILKERTANVVSYTFFTRDVDQYQNRHFHSSINHREQLFHRALITGYFRPVNIAKFLRTGFFIEHLQKQSFADIPQNRVTPLFLKVSQTSQESTCVGVSF